MSELKFPEGINFFKPHENAPDFVKGNISIDKTQFINWLTNQPTDDKGRIKLDLKKSQKGVLYLSVNEYGLNN